MRTIFKNKLIGIFFSCTLSLILFVIFVSCKNGEKKNEKKMEDSALAILTHKSLLQATSNNESDSNVSVSSIKNKMAVNDTINILNFGAKG